MTDTKWTATDRIIKAKTALGECMIDTRVYFEIGAPKEIIVKIGAREPKTFKRRADVAQYLETALELQETRK